MYTEYSIFDECLKGYVYFSFIKAAINMCPFRPNTEKYEYMNKWISKYVEIFLPFKQNL